MHSSKSVKIVIPKIQKKTNCRSCGYFDGRYCRIGLGWSEILNPIRYCDVIKKISPSIPRCGMCKHFSLDSSLRRISGYCSIHCDFRNFHDCCYSGYTKEPGKDLRPKPDKPYFESDE